MAFNSDGGDAGVINATQVDFHVDNVVLTEMPLENVKGVSGKMKENWWNFIEIVNIFREFQEKIEKFTELNENCFKILELFQVFLS